MKQELKNLAEKFKINAKNKSIKPYYLISFTMDSNDGDYMKDTVKFSEQEWKELPLAFLFAILYFGNGYSGKFSHGNNWGKYYGLYFEENEHGLSELADIAAEYDMMCYTDWGRCHSYTKIKIEYFDEQDKRHSVSYPSIDDLFDTEEEMISAIKEAIDIYNDEYVF